MEDKENNPSAIEPQQTAENQTVHKTIRNQRGIWLPIIGIVLVVLILGIGVYYFATKVKQSNNNTSNSVPQPITSNQNISLKTYTNSFYNFKLEIPTNWKVEEEVIQDKKYVNGEYQTYKLSSPNGDLTIDNTSIFNKNNHIKEQLPNTKVQLGTYTVDRYPYINDDNQGIDYVQLLNIKRQQSVTFAFNFNGDIEKNNELLLKILKTFAYTKQEPSLDDYVSYVIPSGWKKENTDTSLSLSFVSSDFHEEGLPTIVSGARIAVGRVKRDPTKTFIQQITPNDIYGMTKVETKNVTFGNMQWTNVYSCGGEFGFCHDSYSIENNGYIWSIAMMCNKDCSTKGGANNTVYAKDRDAFINSITFK